MVVVVVAVVVVVVVVVVEIRAVASAEDRIGRVVARVG